MRRFLRKPLALLVAGASFFGLAAGNADAEMIYSKSQRFRIPFQFDSGELKRIGAKEVRLYVSRDQEQWTVAETVPLTESRFLFEAPEEGEYWFSVKSRLPRGDDYPPGPHQASLHVKVDVTPPQLELDLREVEPGRVRLSWQASDASLDLSTLQLEFMEPGTNLWQPVAIRSQDRGQTSWTTESAGTIQVRGRVGDLAGNQVLSNTELVLEGPPDRSNERPDVGKPVANNEAMPLFDDSRKNSNPIRIESLPITAPVKSVPLATSSMSTPAPASPGNQTTEPAGGTPLRNGVRYLNSLKFRMAYNLQEVGPSGVSQVNLYITENQGSQWFHYGTDPDKTSPMEVSVPNDGEYGLSFRVTNGVGRSPVPPQPGDAPEITIVVDRKPPAAKLHPVRYTDQPELNRVILSWTVQDAHLAERPIALFYSTSPAGPWTPIQDWSPSQGQMNWTVPGNVESFHVRLDARDQAGNLTQVISETPFLMDRAQPRAQVTEIESVHSSHQ